VMRATCHVVKWQSVALLAMMRSMSMKCEVVGGGSGWCIPHISAEALPLPLSSLIIFKSELGALLCI
jgi:hypothetical protein